MGNLKRGWTKRTLLVIIAVGFLFAGVFVSNYFRANAAGNEPQSLQKKKFINRSLSKNATAETNERDTFDLKQEKEWMRKQQTSAESWKKMQGQETSILPENTLTVSAEAQSPSKETTTPQQLESNPVQIEQITPQPENPSAKKTVYLTFDDGPAPFSSEIVALLEQHQFKATFFMIDRNIPKYSDAVKLMVQTGETVGLHSVSHDKKQFYASANSVISELTQNHNTLKEIAGVDSFIMRTPYGSVPHMTPEYRQAVIDNGYLMWDWNIDSKDWYYKDARYVSSIIEQLTKKANDNGPLVILLHERKETLTHLPALLDYLSQQGFEGKPIDSSMTPFQYKN